MAGARLSLFVSSFVGILVFGQMLCIAHDFILLLLAVFFLSLSIFHAILAVWRGITTRIVKGTDYLYFSLVAIGLLLGLLSQDSERQQSYQRFILTQYPPDFSGAKILVGREEAWCGRTFLPSETYSFLQTVLSTLNIGTIARLLPNQIPAHYCAWLREVLSALDQRDLLRIKAVLDQGIQTFHDDPRDVLAAELRDAIAHRRWTTMDRSLTYDLAMPVFGQLKSLLLAQQVHAGASTGSSGEIIGKYVVTSLWPFFVGIGLALRMTKVTAEVSGWPV